LSVPVTGTLASCFFSSVATWRLLTRMPLWCAACLRTLCVTFLLQYHEGQAHLACLLVADAGAHQSGAHLLCEIIQADLLVADAGDIIVADAARAEEAADIRYDQSGCRAEQEEDEDQFQEFSAQTGIKGLHHGGGLLLINKRGTA
jgi:hypothetical protein